MPISVLFEHFENSENQFACLKKIKIIRCEFKKGLWLESNLLSQCSICFNICLISASLETSRILEPDCLEECGVTLDVSLTAPVDPA